jgi:heme-degrading monooxygenase HmoA
VRPNSQAKFEKRWADRSSRLASLEGFRYFHLMRRVALENEVNSGEKYLFCAVWVLYVCSQVSL